MAQIKITEKPVALHAEEDMRFVATQTPDGEEEADVRLIPPEGVSYFAKLFGTSELLKITAIRRSQYDALQSYPSDELFIIYEDDAPSIPSAGGVSF